MYKITIDDAQHPYRQSAIHIISEIVEPILKKTLKGKKYYDIEDKITNIIKHYNEKI